MQTELLEQLKEQLKKHEGLRLKPYRCTANKLTIGYGRNLEDFGILLSEADLMLNNDVNLCVRDMEGLFKDFKDLPKNIQIVLGNMRYNLGYDGLMKFRKTIQAVNNRDWKDMAKQMQDSKWAQQVPTRAQELIQIVLNVN